jgi:hypothetical protein
MKTIEETEEKPNSQVKEKTNIENKIISNLKKTHKFPDNQIKIEAIKVFSNRWRVNVWTDNANKTKIEASWFVIADSDGGIIKVS